ncbi:hypothetical protein JTB14_034954 [Gonioctena quinquepunctata]|nr:hypothetical protein JTB14_034954 [Gonioctena quinquepunctata]
MDKSKKPYTVENIRNALQAFQSVMSISEASRRFNIPRMTLFDEYYGRKNIECKTVVSTILSSEEEEILVDWILIMAKQGFPITKTQLYNQKHWYEGFLSRRKQISKIVTQNLSNPPARGTEAQIRNWFLEIESYFRYRDYLDISKEPRCVYNYDETVILLSSKGDNSFITNVEKECLTALIMCNSKGELPPPLVM